MNKNAFYETLIYAISNEVEAEEFYLEASRKLSDPFLKELFLRLSREEKRHQRILEGFQEKTPVDFHFKEVPDYRVSEHVERPRLSTAMKPADALALAMKNEEEAMNHYTRLADSVSDTEMKRVFYELAAMEREHKFSMEKAFVDIGFPEVW
jgi:rubrerythrin